MTIKEIKQRVRLVIVRRVDVAVAAGQLRLDPLPRRFDTMPINFAALDMLECIYCGQEFARFPGNAGHCRACNARAERVAAGASRKAAA